MAIKYFSDITKDFYPTIEKAMEAEKDSRAIADNLKQQEEVEKERQCEVAQKKKDLATVDMRMNELIKQRDAIKEDIKHINEEADREIRKLKDEIWTGTEDDLIKETVSDAKKLFKATSKRAVTNLKDLLKYYDI